jgi:hypothetical protein
LEAGCAAGGFGETFLDAFFVMLYI